MRGVREAPRRRVDGIGAVSRKPILDEFVEPEVNDHVSLAVRRRHRLVAVRGALPRQVGSTAGVDMHRRLAELAVLHRHAARLARHVFGEEDARAVGGDGEVADAAHAEIEPVGLDELSVRAGGEGDEPRALAGVEPAAVGGPREVDGVLHRIRRHHLHRPAPGVHLRREDPVRMLRVGIAANVHHHRQHSCHFSPCGSCVGPRPFSSTLAARSSLPSRRRQAAKPARAASSFGCTAIRVS